MGIFDSIVGMATGAPGGAAEHSQIASGLVQEMQGMPGGMGGLLQSFQQNGMGNMVQQWSGGQTAPATTGQVEQGLGGTGIIDSIAQRTGMSPGVVKTGLAVLVPVMIHHLVSNGHVDTSGQTTGPAPDAGGLLQSVLGRL